MARYLKHMLFALGFTLLFAPQAYAEWPEQSCSNPYRVPVSVTADSATTNTEIRLELSSGDFPADYVFSANGDDVRVFANDDLTPIDFFVSGWDPAAQTAVVYIRPPAIPVGTTQTFYIYLGDNDLSSAGDSNIVFPDIGVRLRSRVSSVDPTDAVSGRAAFEAATTDVYDQVRTSVNGLNNRALGGTNGNFGWCISAVLNVPAGQAGIWEFRYGGDFGRGGHLYINETPIEEDWNDDLWWAGNYNNTNETLSGAIDLPAGWHRYEALGFEGCCDGGVGFQARRPGDIWRNLTSSNFTLRGTQCIAPDMTISIGPPESCSTELSATKSINVDASSPTPYAIPGAIMRYDLNVENPGQSIDDGTLVLTDNLPEDLTLLTNSFSMTDGGFPSGLTFTYGGVADGTDSVEFSTDGVNFNYQPSSPEDGSVTHIRFRPAGELNPNNAGDKPSFTISILGKIE